ncbi:hypothetical protein [Corynebacterium anserum]|uniref:VG15 protein n=1 Tax=Corynebacterium anserum TaxID=2684406 RepID=UPI001FE6E5C4|nr:hypothetical protein [Corynebacterium anserum]
MLASRGAVYASREHVLRVGAGGLRKGTKRELGVAFHDHCRCLAIEVRRDGSDLPRINRDLERLWSESGSRTQADFKKALGARRLNGAPTWPALKRVKVPAYRSDGMSKAFPGEPLPKDLNRAVAHVLYGWRDRPRKGEGWVPHSEDSRMGHTWDSKRESVSRFPRSWSDQKITDAVVETLENPSFRLSKGTLRNVWKEVDDLTVIADYVVLPNSRVSFVTAHPAGGIAKEAKRVED